MAIHSSTTAWKIPWTEEPGRLPSKGLQTLLYKYITICLPINLLTDICFQVCLGLGFFFAPIMNKHWYTTLCKHMLSPLRLISSSGMAHSASLNL